MILVLDATIRENSRTRELAKYLVSRFNDSIKWVNLEKLDLKPLNGNMLAYREKCIAKNDFSDSYFNPAKDLLEADIIVIAAPYYDLSFPSGLKCYLEHASISNLVFTYDKGIPKGKLKAKMMYYVSTAGGYTNGDIYGYQYVSTLFKSMYGVLDTVRICAEGLDIIENNPKEILENTKNEIDRITK